MIVLLFVIHANCMNAQQIDSSALPRVSIPNTEARHFHSSIVGDDFEISVALPRNYGSTDSTYPVVYTIDANMWFAAGTGIMRWMEARGKLPPIIHIGIGYRSDLKWRKLRGRDLTPTNVSESGVHLPGGAYKFLGFIREELMPFIRANYRVSSDAAIIGGSFGGLFALYVLFHQPETFGRYVIMSPSISWDQSVTFKYEEEYAQNHSDLPVTIFLSAGALEQRADTAAGMVTNLKQLEERLLNRQYNSLRLQTVIFEQEDHVTVYPAAITRGLQAIYKR